MTQVCVEVSPKEPLSALQQGIGEPALATSPGSLVHFRWEVSAMRSQCCKFPELMTNTPQNGESLLSPFLQELLGFTQTSYLIYWSQTPSFLTCSTPLKGWFHSNSRFQAYIIPQALHFRMPFSAMKVFLSPLSLRNKVYQCQSPGTTKEEVQPGSICHHHHLLWSWREE